MQDGPGATTVALILAALGAAVPLHVAELQSLSYDEVLEEAQRASAIVAEKGDIIQYRAKKTGETAKAFNALARGLAALSFSPGGVKFLGERWVNDHPELTRETIVPADVTSDTEPAPPPDFADTLVDTEDEVHLFV